MNGLLIFLLFCCVAVACYFIGERIGYLRGRAEMPVESITLTVSCSKNVDSDALKKELKACGRMT